LSYGRLPVSRPPHSTARSFANEVRAADADRRSEKFRRWERGGPLALRTVLFGERSWGLTDGMLGIGIHGFPVYCFRAG